MAIHPLDNVRRDIQRLFRDIRKDCPVREACDILLTGYIIPPPNRCGDCSEEFIDAIKNSKTWEALQGVEGLLP